MAKKGIGGDWTGYTAAALTAAGDERTGKAFAMLQAMKEKKRDRAVEREKKAIWREGDTSFS